MEYINLSSQGKIENLVVKNRFIMAPMGNNFGTPNEAISLRQLEYYERRARGGAGMMITESCPVDLLGRHGNDRIQIYMENSVEYLSRLTSMVHGYQVKIAIQLTHGGAKSSPALIGEYPAAPSSISIPKKDFIPRCLTQQGISDIVDQFASAARKGLQANFDAVELLAASGHLIHQFLSPVSNQRTDIYGGSLQNRMRFLLEIVAAIKDSTQGCLPIMVKLYGRDPENYTGTKIDEEEFPEIATALYQAGVASIHLSTNFSANPELDFHHLIQLARQIREKSPVKISIAGSLFRPAEAEWILKENIADFIELGRPLLADPDFVHKVLDGQESLIRPCLNCNRCRFETAQKRPIKCTINPFLGRETEEIKNEENSTKNVAIIGGGPAGLQAAIELSKLGHKGIVFEKGEKLAGLLWAAATAPSKERMKLFIAFLIGQVQKTRFEIKTGYEIDVDRIKDFLDESWDAIILATGAKPYQLKTIPLDCPNVYMAGDVLAEKKFFEGTVIILGGGQVGCEAADFLSENGASQVVLMATSSKIAANVIPQEREPLLKRIGEKGVRVLVNASPIEYDGKILQYQHNNIEKSIECATVIIAKGWEADCALKEAIEKYYKGKVYLVGDAAYPRSLLEALEEGVAVAAEIDQL